MLLDSPSIKNVQHLTWNWWRSTSLFTKPHIQKNSIIIENDINNNLNFNIFEKRFDIIFMDPPYKDNNLPSILSNIIKFKMLNNDGIIVIHRHRKQEDKFPPDFFIIEEKIYGISKVIFGRYFK